jgi:hypothetical protein
MNRLLYKFRGLAVFVALAVIAAFGAVTMFLWNNLLPGIFGLPVLEYWQALGIFVLSRVLFSGIGGGMGKGGGVHGAFWDRASHCGDPRHRNPLREKWMNMSEEERKAFHDRFPHFNDLRAHFSDMRNFYEEREANQKKDTNDQGASGATKGGSGATKGASDE